MSGKVPGLSLCMIVRDEEERLPRALAAARPFVDEIVVVDTGSKDRTREIAASYGAVVDAFDWADDFAAARNRSLDLAGREWALILDADEVLSEEAGRELRAATLRRDAVGVYLPFRNVYDGGREIVTLMVRAVRNRPDVRFRYRIHEQILSPVLAVAEAEGLRLLSIKGEVMHDGYLGTVMESKEKNTRNRRLFEAQLAETPDDLYVLYRYADFLRRFPAEQERAARLIREGYERLAGMTRRARHGLTFAGEICALHALGRKAGGDAPAAWAAARFGLDECVVTPNLLYVAGLCALDVGEPAEAAELFRACRAEDRKALPVPAQPGITTWRSGIGLVRALLAGGEASEAARLAREILGQEPENPEVVAAWVDAEAALGDLPGLVRALVARVGERPRCGATWLKGAEVLARAGLFDRALPWTAHAAELLPEPAAAHGLQGLCLLAAGRVELALDAFGRGFPEVRCRAGLLLVSLVYGIPPEVKPDLEDAALRREFQTLLAVLRATGQTRHLDRLRESLRAFETSHPEAFAFLDEVLLHQA